MNAQQTTQFIPQDAWIVDSGASHHMTSDINSLNHVTPFEGSEKITIGNGQEEKGNSVSRKDPIHESQLPVSSFPNPQASISAEVNISRHHSPFISDNDIALVSDSQDNESASTTGFTLSSHNDTTLLLHVLNLAQLQVVLPFDTCPSSSASDNVSIQSHRMQTQLQIGAITRKSYTNYLALLPELSSLQLMDCSSDSQCLHPYQAGFSFLANVSDHEVPKTFKGAANSKPDWLHRDLHKNMVLITLKLLVMLLDILQSGLYLHLLLNLVGPCDNWMSKMHFYMAPRAWNSKFTSYLLALGFTPSLSNTNINTRRSISGFVVYIGSNPVSWQSKKQSTVSRSSTEAEYKALAQWAADVSWIRSVFKDIHQFLPRPPSLHCANLFALALSSNPVFHSKIKHLDTDYHFVKKKYKR
ncbi:uncharacterized protein LOC126615432 [Malus sylvestris]|uniref:uncharacterized protein LOC126615432 n=1 Tax=Malus sylvestris TaxID=3752 RepID=UPI0021AC3219|nr:uncharacterized protein LOC126615432 [Malus sylvestris]